MHVTQKNVFSLCKSTKDPHTSYIGNYKLDLGYKHSSITNGIKILYLIEQWIEEICNARNTAFSIKFISPYSRLIMLLSYNKLKFIMLMGIEYLNEI